MLPVRRLPVMPRDQHHPTPEERDERVKLDLPPDEAIKLIMETGTQVGQGASAGDRLNDDGD